MRFSEMCFVRLYRVKSAKEMSSDMFFGATSRGRGDFNFAMVSHSIMENNLILKHLK